MLQELYDQDFGQWLEQTIQHLQNQQFADLDREHLIEELADLGKFNRRSLESNLIILLAHLLKLTVQRDVPAMMKLSWLNSVSEHRQRILYDLSEIPSLKPYLDAAIAKIYGSARKLAIKEGKRASCGLQIPAENNYPLLCPFTTAQILGEDFEGLA